jgi:Kef-type K+ transport system membrane component KefB
VEGDSVLVEIFLLFAAAKLLGEVFAYFHQPAVVGELLGGIMVGPHTLGLIGTVNEPVFEALAQLGVMILLFTAGLETSVSDLRRVGRAAVSVGVLGEALGFGAGLGLMLLFGYGGQTAVFGAAAIVATSVGIAARVLTDFGAVRSGVGRVILGAAVVDDILAIIVLAVIAGIAAGDVSSVAVVLSLLEVLVFLVIVAFAGPPVTRRLSRLAHLPGIPDSPFLVAVLLTLGLAALSEVIGLAAIVGAFLAGLIFEFRRDKVATQVEPVYELLVPFFFAVTGSRLDPRAFTEPDVLGLTAALVALALITKLAAGAVGARPLGPRAALTVGVGMIPRGEVSLLVATTALALGVFTPDLFAAVVAVVVVTSLLTPAVLGPMVRRRHREELEGGPEVEERRDG